jgi:hypothetical protein
MSAVANNSWAGGQSGRPGNNRQKILLAVLVVVLLGLLAFQLPKLLGDDSVSRTATTRAAGAARAVATPSSPAAATAVAAAPGATAAAAAADRRIERQIKRMPARDPFVPLLGPGSAAATATTPTTPAPAAPATPAPPAAPATPAAPAAPAVVPTSAVIFANGRRYVAGVNQQFVVGDTTFRLVSVTRNGARIAVVLGSLAGAESTIRLPRGDAVTLENRTTGVRYVLRFTLPLTAVPSRGGGAS